MKGSNEDSKIDQKKYEEKKKALQDKAARRRPFYLTGWIVMTLWLVLPKYWPCSLTLSFSI